MRYPKDLSSVRLANLLALLAEDSGPERGKKKRLAARIGKSAAQVSQWLSGYRTIEEGSAREIEVKAGKPPLWLDGTHSRISSQVSTNTESGPDLRPSIRVPVVGSVKGGADGYMEELQYPVGEGEGFVEYWTPDKSAYALRVKGDSMHPRYRAGEFIVVTPSIEPQPGRDVVVKLKDGQKLLKQLNWIRGGEVQLLSINNGYAPMTIDLEDVEAIQRVGGSVPSDAFINT